MGSDALAVDAAAQQASGGDQRSPSLTFLYKKPVSSELQQLFETLRDSEFLNRGQATSIEPSSRCRIQLKRRLQNAEKRSLGMTPSSSGLLSVMKKQIAFPDAAPVGYEYRRRCSPVSIGTLLYEFYHELAHTLIDMLWLPVLGREEDSADQFAVIALLGHPEGWKLALGAAYYLHEMIAIETDLGLDPAHRHPFFSQR